MTQFGQYAAKLNVYSFMLYPLFLEQFICVFIRGKNTPINHIKCVLNHILFKKMINVGNHIAVNTAFTAIPKAAYLPATLPRCQACAVPMA